MAYTKYSLTPANNNSAPPDGAPEGMLPSAVNDTMRDMMAQIRDCGDGIRDGTYTMTAPKITGGTITGVTFTSIVVTGGSITGATVTSNTFSSSGATITGGTINSTAIGGTTAAAGKFTTLEATGVTTVQAGTAALPAITTTGDTNTGIFFSAADTIDFTEGGVATGQFDSSGNFKFNSGYGSVATAYGCRAWVNFNGTGTVAIRGSGNVTSITDDGVGIYTVVIDNDMPDANYASIGMSGDNRIIGSGLIGVNTASACKISVQSSGSLVDEPYIFVAIFR
jgi:hypothetical protein